MKYTIIELDETPSTNDEAKRLGLDGFPSGTVITAKRQTSGRGRMGRSFFSEDGGLFLSVILRGIAWRERPGLLTLAAGVAVAEALSKIRLKKIGIDVRLKWPNDVIMNGKKICGILAERSVLGDNDFVVLGIGVNVNVKCFPPELKNIATSLFLETGKRFNIRRLLDDILGFFETKRGMLESGRWAEVLDEYREICLNIGKPVIITDTHTNERTIGIAIGVDGDGGLITQTSEGIVAFRSGVVTLKGTDET